VTNSAYGHDASTSVGRGLDVSEAVDETRDWGAFREDRCPVCFVPPGAPHIEEDCVYSGVWEGPGPDAAHCADGGA
jgi:hypothetical protein